MYNLGGDTNNKKKEFHEDMKVKKRKRKKTGKKFSEQRINV